MPLNSAFCPPSSLRRRILIAVAATTALIGGLLLSGATPGHAATTLISCLGGSQTATYDPPLTNEDYLKVVSL
jgi:hypothetical protein